MGNFNMANSPFAIKAYDRWLSELGEMYNVDILNMIHWEDVEGSWQAMSQLEWDPVHEIFEPFNCRTFLVNLLSVDEKYREGPDFQCHIEMIRKLWPELLKVPINPKFNPEKAKAAMAFMAIKLFLKNKRIDKFIPDTIRGFGRTLLGLR
jgi:mRNA deadenylase 3'-5' endonuclease subunit Ccr4